MNNIIIFFSKTAKKLHLNRFTYKVIKKIYSLTHNRQTILINTNQAEKFLQEISEDPDSSCVCANNISNKKKWDLQIIIPVYNTEKYLKRCIDSIISQETLYKFKLVVINDGSSDTSRRILTSYENFNNIQIIDQDNRGFSGARNKGLEFINAKYIMFVDSDDMLNSNAIQALLDKAFKLDADIVEGSFNYFNHSGCIRTVKLKNIDNVKGLHGFPWGKVYKSELFKNIHFPNGYWFEDTINNLIIFPKSKCSATIENIVYNYRINQEGISQSSKGKNKNLDTFYITKRLLKDLVILNIELSKEIHDNFITQIYINNIRIQTLNNEKINKAIFLLSCKLYNDYFKDIQDYKINNDYKIAEMAKSLRQKNYYTYTLSNLLLT